LEIRCGLVIGKGGLGRLSGFLDFVPAIIA
jgi:hypothetical protein